MEELLHLNEGSGERHGSKMPIILAALLITLTATSCGNDRLRSIDGKIVDTADEIYTRGDKQRRINREGNTYISHFGQGDDEDLLKLENQTNQRASKNRKKRSKAIDKLGRLLGKRDNIRAKVNSRINTQYDEHECEISDQAIREALDIEYE